MLTGSASYILMSGPTPLSVPGGVSSGAAIGGSTAGAACCGSETTFAWSGSFAEEEEEEEEEEGGAWSECLPNHVANALAAACESSVRSSTRRASTLASSAGAARFSSTAVRSSTAARPIMSGSPGTRGELTGAASHSCWLRYGPVLEDGMGAPPAEYGSVDGGVATMTCVPRVAVLEPGSAPESRTDSKRDSEEEPVRELEREERRENIDQCVEYASAAPSKNKAHSCLHARYIGDNAG